MESGVQSIYLLWTVTLFFHPIQCISMDYGHLSPWWALSISVWHLTKSPPQGRPPAWSLTKSETCSSPSAAPEDTHVCVQTYMQAKTRRLLGYCYWARPQAWPLRGNGVSRSPRALPEICHSDVNATMWSCHFGGDPQERQLARQLGFSSPEGLSLWSVFPVSICPCQENIAPFPHPKN